MNSKVKDQLPAFISSGNISVSGLRQSLSSDLAVVIQKTLGVEMPPGDILFERSINPDFGDLSTNVLLQLVNSNKKIGSLTEAGNQVIEAWGKSKPQEVDKIELVNGFLNIWLNNDGLISQVKQVLSQKDSYGANTLLDGKTILLEHTSPNPQTTIMLGHLRNNFLGMAVGRLFENAGAKVIYDCVVNDRGIHLCRSMMGYLVYGQKNIFSKEELLDYKNIDDQKLRQIFVKEVLKGDIVDYFRLLNDWRDKPGEWWVPEDLGLKSDHANLIWYVLGSRIYGLEVGNTDLDAKLTVRKMLLDWEKGMVKDGKKRTAEETALVSLWHQIMSWSEEGYKQTYQRIGSHHDKYWYESNYWQEGKEIVDEGIKRGVFKIGEVDPNTGKKPIVTDLSKEGLPDTVVIKSDGTALYLTQDLELTRQKIEKYPADWYVWDIGMEQTLYFKQLFAVAAKLGLAPREKLYHLSYALINFKGGRKMATRRGDVVAADETLDMLKERTAKIIETSDQNNRVDLTEEQLSEIAEKVAVGAAKFSLLKYGRDTTIQFDIDESLSLSGNSGPYLQYTYARTRSVLLKSKANELKLAVGDPGLVLADEERDLLRTIYWFPDVVIQATEELAPNLVCNYLFDLAQKFNLFYARCRILASVGETKSGSENQQALRLALTFTVGQIIKNGLMLLGIESPEKM